ncbi:hypothetical protein ACOMHN_061973 [Nucella lapillus]
MRESPQEDERRGVAHPSPQNALRVKQIVPGASHRLASPPAPMPGRLPPLEASASMPSQRKFGHRASSAMDNKEGRKQGGRERNNSSSEVSRPSTTQAFRSETPFGVHNLRSSAPMIHSIPARQLYVMGGNCGGLNVMGNGNSGGLNVMGNGLYPSAEGPPNVLEDQEGPSVDRHTQWSECAQRPQLQFLQAQTHPAQLTSPSLPPYRGNADCVSVCGNADCVSVCGNADCVSVCGNADCVSVCGNADCVSVCGNADCVSVGMLTVSLSVGMLTVSLSVGMLTVSLSVGMLTVSLSVGMLTVSLSVGMLTVSLSVGMLTVLWEC